MCVTSGGGGRARALQEARQRAGVTTVRTGGVLGTLAGGAAAVRGLASKKAMDTSLTAMTTSKPVFQVGVYLASTAAVVVLGRGKGGGRLCCRHFILLGAVHKRWWCLAVSCLVLLTSWWFVLCYSSYCCAVGDFYCVVVYSFELKKVVAFCLCLRLS